MRKNKATLALTAITVLPFSLSAALGLTASAAPAPAPLPVTLSADGNGTAVFDAHGDPVLTLGATSTYAQLAVNLKATGHKEPAGPPAFTTTGYAAGSPRWVIELADGYYLFGMPAQFGGGALTDFTGPQWSVQGPAQTPGCGTSFITYAKALACADPDAGSHVISAYIVEDTDQPPTVADTLTGVQYDGELVSGGPVTVTLVPAQAVTTGVKAAPLAVKATTTSSDPALTYTAGGLPAGLVIDPATGVISGTPAAGDHSGTATVTVTSAYGGTGTVPVQYTVSPPAPVLSAGHVASVTSTTAALTWKSTVASTFTVTVHGPGPANGHTQLVTSPKATVAGLLPHHTYTVTIQAEVSGTPAGKPGNITVITS